MNRPVLIVLLVALPLGIGAFLMLTRNDPERGGERKLPDLGAEARDVEEPAAELIPPAVVRTPVGSAGTTVLWPVKVELELLAARFLPKEEGVAPVGSGAGARLSGRVADVNDKGAAAEIRFTAGANAGRVLHADADGRFGAVDLYPGLSVVEVHGAGTLGSRREVRLRRGQETLLNIGYGRPGMVSGKVQDSTGKGLADAAVVIDGTRVLTDVQGAFFAPTVAAGQVLCEVEKDGFAFYQELVWIAGGGTTSGERVTFTLKPEVELHVAVTGAAGGPGPALVYLFSDRPEYNANSAFRNESFPWHKIGPVEVWPGRPATIGKLPPEVAKVYVFRTGARAAFKTVNLGSNMRDVSIELQPAPTLTGIVKQGGQPVLGAVVKLEAPDRVRATLGYFSEQSYFLETAVMPNLPPGLQEMKTGSDGRFTFSAWSDVSPVRYLEARGPGGAWAGRFVKPEDTVVELELGALPLGESTLLVEFPDRHQGLPIELWIGGAPVSEQVLGPDDDLEVSNLVAGQWRATVTWHAQPVLPAQDLTVEDVKRLKVPLPLECIEGQDEEQWKRAGREYPHGS